MSLTTSWMWSMSRPRCSSVVSMACPREWGAKNSNPPPWRESESMTSCIGLDEPVDAASQCQHRDTAARHQRVVELAEVEALAQRLLRLRAQPVDLAVSHFVSAGLAGPGAIAIHFARDFVDR